MSESKNRPIPPPASLYKTRSWSTDTFREETWCRRKGMHRLRRGGRSKSVSDEDLDELMACFELGFGFDSPDIDAKLADAFPALEFYCAVNKHYTRRLFRSSSSISSDFDSPSSKSSIESPSTIFEPGEDPDMVKTRLRQWAQVVACAVRQGSPSSSVP